MISTAIRSLLPVFILLFAAQPIRMSSAQENQEKAGAAPYYSLLTEGMLAGPVFPYEFQSAKLRLEVRNLILGHSKASDVPTPTDILMELRGGAVITTINGQAEERLQGDFWTVERGSKLAIENQGQAAVIRAVYVYPGSK
jgi:hypothetical protein